MSRRFAGSVLALSLTFGAAPTLAAAQDLSVSPQRLSDITRDLSSEAFAGRAPGGPGEGLTVDYLVSRFKALGLEPSGDDGSWTQTVPLVRLKPEGPVTLGLATAGGSLAVKQAQEIQISTLRPVDRVTFRDAPLVFVGYGVTAPERGWDDFKGVDLKGKIAVILISDPDFEAGPDEPVAGKFAGKAATYYARWTYKYEEAVRRGALGALIVHEAPGAGYGWSTVIAPAGEGYDIVRDDPAREKLLVQGWIQRDAAAELFRRSGQDFEALKLAARRADFRPVPLAGASLSADFAVRHERMDSRNILARLPGTSHPDETILYAAHWDAFGIGAPDAQGRTIRPGAADDAIGVAAVLETARTLAAGPRPQRSILFAAWTAEERGLLGSEYYAARHEAQLSKMVANFTFDVLQTKGPARDVVLVGAGQNALEDRLAQAALAQGRTITPDARPERALFYRADHFSLAKRGVPVLLLMGLGGGADLVEGGRAAGEAWVADYTARCYHQTCDAWSADWDLRGAAQDVELTVRVGQDLANSRVWPDWKAGSEFKPIRAATAASRP
ncbi:MULTISPECIES: M28 family metallopeptidase [unclassified Caulobacter]|uniref:M28 family metallopeptidase n=1 Tax=unclassified Caulobacter TaxID=2648921 RepID=UPI000D33A030|nr:MULTISPECIES: M28 family metallopeptidase [unclassified Caulobacter]PTS89081.1 peptidase M20 [Caulobacter sp. HMWF009]PTT05061.1 peptidase M20 [Caulobacter sp. HMWF025]